MCVLRLYSDWDLLPGGTTETTQLVKRFSNAALAPVIAIFGPPRSKETMWMFNEVKKAVLGPM